MGKLSLKEIKELIQKTEEEREKLLSRWEELDEEEQFLLKEALLYNKYGTGGEYYSIIPNLINYKRENPELKEYFEIPKTIRQSLLDGKEENGSIQILPIDKDKTLYTTILLPEKTIEITPFQLLHGTGEQKTKYYTIKPLKPIKVTKNQFLITNIYSNKNKAFTQARYLSVLFEMGGNSFKELEQQKEGKKMVLNLDIQDGKMIYKKSSGEIFETLDEVLKRKSNPFQKNIDKIIKTIG